jgi:hypothetical protein
MAELALVLAIHRTTVSQVMALPDDQGIKHVNGPGLITAGGGFCHVWLRTEA